MHMYECMYVYMLHQVCIYARMYAYMCIRLHVCLHVYLSQ